MTPLLVALLLSTYELPPFPAPQPDDGIEITTTIGEMRNALWYYDQFHLALEHIEEDLYPAIEALRNDRDAIAENRDHWRDAARTQASRADRNRTIAYVATSAATALLLVTTILILTR